MTKQASLDRWRVGRRRRGPPDAGRRRGRRGVEPRLPAAARALRGILPAAAGLPRHGRRARDATYEVLSETELPEDGLVVYRLRALAGGRGGARPRRLRSRPSCARRRPSASSPESARAARPFRFLLYPIVGLLPEEDQVRLSDRLGLYAVTATLVSGLVEALVILVAAGARSRRRGSASAILAVSALRRLRRCSRCRPSAAPSAAFFLRETGGSAPVVLLCRGAAGARRPLRARRPHARAAHARRLLGAARAADAVTPTATARSSTAASSRTSVGRHASGSNAAATTGRWSRSRPSSIADAWSTRTACVPMASAADAGRRPAQPPPATRLRERGPRGGAPRVGRVERGLRWAHVPARPQSSRRAPSTTAAGRRPCGARRSGPRGRAFLASTC